jgi:hypothetical protein
MTGGTRAVVVGVVALALSALAPTAGAAVATFPVVANNDDAFEQPPSTMFIGTDPMVVRSGVLAGDLLHAGFRFPAVTVARGSAVSRATLEVYAVDGTGSYDDLSATVYGHASDNSPGFGATPNNISNRTTTAAFQTLHRPNWGGPGWRHVDVTKIVQEIVDRPGWASGNALSILLKGGTALPVGEFRMEPIENAGTNHARLTIDWGDAGDLYLREHPSGQPADQFGTFPVYAGIPLYRFRLQNATAAPVSVTSLRLRPRACAGSPPPTSPPRRIHDGTVDVATGGVPVMGRTTGTITFTPGAWTVPASSTVDYTVYADVGALAPWDTLFLSLAGADTTASATVSGGRSAAPGTWPTRP